MLDPNTEKINEIITFLKLSQTPNNNVQKVAYKVIFISNSFSNSKIMLKIQIFLNVSFILCHPLLSQKIFAA